MELEKMYGDLGISKEVLEYGARIEAALEDRFTEIDGNAEYNQLKVIAAMQKNRVSDIHFSGTTGYGYNDLGRETLEQVYADVFHTEDALVRPQIVCGTHALYTALAGNLRPGDELLSPVGKPYDTLEEVIGIRESNGSLREYGISYRQVDLLPDGTFDYDGIRAAINEKTKLVTIQRSKGYASRPTLSAEQIGELIAFVKSIKPEVICMVDNCYGEFVERIEPSDLGADMVVGSLIKNPGGGLAPIGGYIAGTRQCIENAAYRLGSPGLGREVGASLGVNQSFFQGLFLAPTVVSGALKGAIFAANVYERLGFDVVPNSTEPRYDIIQAITFGKPEGVIVVYPCLIRNPGFREDSFAVYIPDGHKQTGFKTCHRCPVSVFVIKTGACSVIIPVFHSIRIPVQLETFLNLIDCGQQKLFGLFRFRGILLCFLCIPVCDGMMKIGNSVICRLLLLSTCHKQTQPKKQTQICNCFFNSVSSHILSIAHSSQKRKQIFQKMFPCRLRCNQPV